METSIKLVEYKIHKMNCEWQYGDSQDQGKSNMSIDYKVYQNMEKTHLYRLDVFVKSIPEEGYCGPKIDTTIIGIFSIEQSETEKERQSMIRYTGFPLLYSTLRGYISTVTSNFPGGTFLLPSIMVKEVVEAIEKNKHQNKN